jgi:cell division protein FtsW (lipid II flippase)
VSVLTFIPVPLKVDDSPACRYRQALAYWQGDMKGNQYMVVAGSLAGMRKHQLERVVGWLRQSDRKLAGDMGYQLRMSMIVLGTGGTTGKAAADVGESYFHMLPEEHTDFIFAVIGGHWGFAGCVGVLLIYCVIVIAGAVIASGTDDPFGRLVAVGVMALLVTQMFINIGMTMGMVPITGMTLPLVSFGGSSLVINAVALGLLVNVGMRQSIAFGRRPFEFGGGANSDGATPLTRASLSRRMPK